MFSILGDKEAMAKLGERIRAQRLRRNMPQEQIATILGVSLPTYRKIETGDGSVEFRHVAKALGVLGFAEALGSLIPEVEPEMRLNDLLSPERKRAYQGKRTKR